MDEGIQNVEDGTDQKLRLTSSYPPAFIQKIKHPGDKVFTKFPNSFQLSLAGISIPIIPAMCIPYLTLCVILILC